MNTGSLPINANIVPLVEVGVSPAVEGVRPAPRFAWEQVCGCTLSCQEVNKPAQFDNAPRPKCLLAGQPVEMCSSSHGHAHFLLQGRQV
jgi:hypothetical protein